MDEIIREESKLAKKVKTLLEKEEAVLARAVATTLQRYNENPTTQNVKDYGAAKKAFNDFKAREAAEPGENRFSNLLEVLDYLAGEGWKVSKSKLYDDQGKIDREKDGSILASAADRYARLCLPRLDGAQDDFGGLTDKKVRLEIDILEEKKTKERRENEIEAGKWVLKSEIETMLARRAALLKSGVGPEFIHAQAPRIIDLVNGDHGKAPELIEHWLRETESLFDRYSRPIEFSAPAYNSRKEEPEA